jgi:hypothetical protein
MLSAAHLMPYAVGLSHPKGYLFSILLFQTAKALLKKEK